MIQEEIKDRELIENVAYLKAWTESDGKSSEKRNKRKNWSNWPLTMRSLF